MKHKTHPTLVPFGRMFLVLACFFIEQALSANRGPTEKFYSTVLTNYSNDIAPWDKSGSQVVLVFQVPFLVLAALEENTQTVSYIAKIAVSWVDPRLEYDETTLGARYVIVPSTKLWMPTFEVYNSVDVHQMDQQQTYNEAEVYANGTVSILWKARFDVICQLYMDNFPFDYQYCPISFSCGLSAIEQLKATTISRPDDFLVGNPEWEVSPPILDSYSYEAGGKNLSLAMISYKVTRNSEFYIYFLILPTFIITTTCLGALVIPLKMEIGEKISLALAGLLGLTFMLSVIVQELPRTATIPLMGKWLLIQMLFCIFGILSDVPFEIVYKKYKRQPQKARIFVFVLMTVILTAHLLTSILLFVVIPPQPHPSSYQNL